MSNLTRLENKTITRRILYWLLPLSLAIPLLLGLLQLHINRLNIYSHTTNILIFAAITATSMFLIALISIMFIYKEEKKLRTSEKLSRLLVENRKDYGIFMLDPQGTIINWNKGAELLTGYTSTEIVGKPFHLLHTLEEQQNNAPHELLKNTVLQHQIESEGWRIKKNGHRFWANITITAIFNDNHQLEGFTKLIRNTTRRKDAETKFSLLLESAPGAIIIIDSNHQIILANAKTEKIFNYPLNELLNNNIEQLIPDNQIHALLLQPTDTELELYGQQKDGTTFPVEITLSPLDTSEGRLIIAAVRDISVRKASEEKLKTLINSLARSNKELERFAYIASHDLQEPLRMISSYTQLLAKKYKDKLDAEANEFIYFAVDGAMRMQQLITDLLSYSRIVTKGKSFSPTQMDTVLSQAIQNLLVSIKESNAVITHAPLPTIQGDSIQLMQVFQNLISNAIKFHQGLNPIIHISVTSKPTEWLFSIQDNGIGIASEFHEKIFLIFHRLHSKKEYEGTGVGLAICKKIIERHGGKIWVESKLEEGSKFCFSLPK
jgi:PAS domain S-box-containing protein